MKKQDQLIKLFADLFDGSPWMDVNIASTLDEITAKEAATKPFPNFNSIWEIVNHMIAWRETVLKRMQGENIESPEDNYFSYLRDRSEEAWRKTRERFRESQQQWLKAIRKMKGKDFELKHDFSSYSNHELVQGILEHDAYHLGQIRLQKKLVHLP